MAKLIIRLINAVGETVNSDPDVNRFIKVAFVPNFSVKNAATDLPRRRSVRADLDGGQGGVGHRQHEVHDERRLDHRHPRRRERRDARGGRRRELLPVRPRPSTRSSASSATATGRRTTSTPIAELAAVLDLIAGGTILARRRRGVPPTRRQPAPRRPVPGPRRLCVLRRMPGAGERRVAGRPRLDADVDPQHARAAESSHRTAPSPSTATTSGTSVR